MLENATSTDIIKIIDHMKDIITPIGVEVYKIYFLVIAVLIVFISALDGIPGDIMHILNPDYYIIQNLLHG